MTSSQPLADFIKRLQDVVLEFEGTRQGRWPQRALERATVAATQRLVSQPLTSMAHGLAISKLSLRDDAGILHSVGRRIGKKGVTAVDLTRLALLRTLDPNRPGSTPDVAAWGTQAIVDGKDSIDIIFEVVDAGYFQFLRSNENAQVLELFGWLGAHEDPELEEACRVRQIAVQSAVADGLQVMMDRDGRVPACGIGVQQIAAMCVGLVEGALKNYYIDPKSFNGDQLAAAAASIIAVLTVKKSATASVKQRLAAIWVV